MNFSGFSERIIECSSAILNRSSLSEADLAASLELSAAEFSPECVHVRLSQLGEELKSEVTRPHAEQILGEAAHLFDVNPTSLFLESLQRSVSGAFIRGLRELCPSHSLKKDGERYVVVIPHALSEEIERQVVAIARKCDIEMELALSEGVHLAFIGGHDLPRFIEIFEQAAASNYRPEIRVPGGICAPFQLHECPMAGIVTMFAAAYRATAKELDTFSSSVGDSVTRRVLGEVTRRPGLLFFDHLCTRSPEICDMIKPYGDVRSYLRDRIGRNPVLQEALSSLLDCSARVMDHVIENNPGKLEFRAAMRPDSLLSPMLRSIQGGIEQVVGAKLSLDESIQLRNCVLGQLERDPWYGAHLPRSFSLDVPSEATEPYSRLAVKVFPAFNRSENSKATKRLQVVLPVKPAEIEGDPQIDYERARSLTQQLTALLDELELVDRFSGAEKVEYVGEEVLEVLNESFRSFQEISQHGVRHISPTFEHLGHTRAIMQFIAVWHGCSWLEKRIPETNSDQLFDRIDNWIFDYTAQKGIDYRLSISDLAGIASMFAGFAAHEHPEESEPSIESINQLFRAHKPLIQVMPSALHALLWLLPERGQETLGALLESKLVLVDRPTAGSITFLKSTNPAAARPLVRDFLKTIGDQGPLRLSAFISA